MPRHIVLLLIQKKLQFNSNYSRFSSGKKKTDSQIGISELIRLVRLVYLRPPTKPNGISTRALSFSFYPKSLLLLIILELFKDHPTCFSTKACTHQAAYPAMTTLRPGVPSKTRRILQPVHHFRTTMYRD